MEERKLKKRQLKWRILKSIFLILTVSMTISTIIGFFYFEHVVRGQKISDEQTRMKQVCSQIGFMAEEIKTFAQSILIDKELQELLDKKEFQSEFERQSTYDGIAKRLTFYNSLRTFINNSILQMEDGTCYGTAYTYMDTGYVEKKLERKEIVRYQQSDATYSDPYINEQGETLICYRVQMWDKYVFGTPKAALYLELDMEYFLEQIRMYSALYDNVCLLGDNGKILYDQDPDKVIQGFLESKKELPESGVYKIKGGYLLFDTIGTAGWKVCTLVTNEYLWQRSQFVLVFFVLSFVLTICLILIVITRIMENMIQPVVKLSRQMEKIEYGKFEMVEMVRTGDEIETLYECFRDMLCEIKKGTEQRMQYESQKKEMEFDIMLSQIHPHYLYNVLNTVVYLAAAKKDWDVVKIVRSLIYTLQETLNVGEHTIKTTIEKELELTKCYLTIQEYRYPGMYTVDIACEEKYKNYLVPKTIIQPLVENAILHGILPGESPGMISICIIEEEGFLKITVKDNGVGIAQDCLERFERGEYISTKNKERKHIGISNVRDRIDHLYGKPYGMKIVRGEEKGTSVILKLPLIPQETETEEQKEQTVQEVAGSEKGTE